MPPKDHPAPRPLNAEDLSAVSGGLTMLHEQTVLANDLTAPPLEDGSAPLSDEDAPQVTNATVTPTGSDHNAVWRPGDGNLEFQAGQIYPGVGHFNTLTLDLSGLNMQHVHDSLRDAAAEMGMPAPPNPHAPFVLMGDQIIATYGQGKLVLFGETITFSGINRIQLTGLE